MDFQHLGGPRNVSVDLKYDFCACECLCTVYLFESEEVMAWILYWWAGLLQPYIDSATALSDIKGPGRGRELESFVFLRFPRLATSKP